MSNRWAILVSGGGTTAQAALDCLSFSDIRLVASSKKNAFALVRARRNGISTFILDKNIDWAALDQELEKFRISRIFLLGFLRILPKEFCQKWQGRMWNVHPSLLPDFKGLHALEKSFEANADMGVSVHEVTAGLDEGSVIYQQKVFSSGFKDNIHQVKMMMAFTEQKLIRQMMMQKGVC